MFLDRQYAFPDKITLHDLCTWTLWPCYFKLLSEFNVLTISIMYCVWWRRLTVGTENMFPLRSKFCKQTLLEVRSKFGTTLLVLRHNFACFTTQIHLYYDTTLLVLRHSFAQTLAQLCLNLDTIWLKFRTTSQKLCSYFGKATLRPWHNF